LTDGRLTEEPGDPPSESNGITAPVSTPVSTRASKRKRESSPPPFEKATVTPSNKAEKKGKGKKKKDSKLAGKSEAKDTYQGVSTRASKRKRESSPSLFEKITVATPDKAEKGKGKNKKVSKLAGKRDSKDTNQGAVDQTTGLGTIHVKPRRKTQSTQSVGSAASREAREVFYSPQPGEEAVRRTSPRKDHSGVFRAGTKRRRDSEIPAKDDGEGRGLINYA